MAPSLAHRAEDHHVSPIGLGGSLKESDSSIHCGDDAQSINVSTSSSTSPHHEIRWTSEVRWKGRVKADLWVVKFVITGRLRCLETCLLGPVSRMSEQTASKMRNGRICVAMAHKRSRTSIRPTAYLDVCESVKAWKRGSIPVAGSAKHRVPQRWYSNNRLNRLRRSH